MRVRLPRSLAVVPLLALLAARASTRAAPPPDGRGWLGEELPLPLAVRTAQDLAVKAAAEKQYLIFNLLAGGNLAWAPGRVARPPPPPRLPPPPRRPRYPRPGRPWKPKPAPVHPARWPRSAEP